MSSPETLSGASRPRVTYVLPDIQGGVSSVVANHLVHRAPDDFAYDVVRTWNRIGAVHRRNAEPYRADRDIAVEFALPFENLRAVLRRLARAIPPGPGVLVCNDGLELAMLHVYDPGRMVVQVLHGDFPYYYRLAEQHQSVIDVFVPCSAHIARRLAERLPHRRDDIHYLPHGVASVPRVRRASGGSLRLLFAGRLEHGQKGVLDLPRIDEALLARGVEASWTVIGDGPDAAALRRAWAGAGGERVRLLGSQRNDEVLAACAEHDVFVLPTRHEGFPVALLEAMGAGLVPVISDIESGVPEVVTPGITGFRPSVGDVAAFAAAIAGLDANRRLLETMSVAAREEITRRFDVRDRVRSYQELYWRWRELRRPRGPRVPLPIGSRLDRPWIPNPVVYALRSGAHFVRALRAAH